MRIEVELWWRQALKDLEAAEKNFELGEYFVTAFLCQQSVEKALKGLYIHKLKESPSTTHSLIYLGRKVEIPEDYESLFRRIQPDFVMIRYPDAAQALPHELYDEEIARETGNSQEGDRVGEKRAEEIKDFIEKVKKVFEPEVMIIFGSRARGDELRESDYDMIIVSEKFRGINFVRRMEKVYKLWDLDERADIICYTPEEFEEKKKQIGLVRRAVEEGIML